jgi:hypothetical protein
MLCRRWLGPTCVAPGALQDRALEGTFSPCPSYTTKPCRSASSNLS